MALTTLKTAVVAPTPSARVTIAITAKTGFFRKLRKANRQSLSTCCIVISLSNPALWKSPNSDLRLQVPDQPANNPRHRLIFFPRDGLQGRVFLLTDPEVQLVACSRFTLGVRRCGRRRS